METITVIVRSDSESDEALFKHTLNRVEEFDVIITSDGGKYKIYYITMPNDALCGIKLSVAAMAANMIWEFYQDQKF